MSTLKVEVVKISRIEKHPNADRLDLVYVCDWQCVTQKDKFMVDQVVAYIPIDSLLPQKLEEYLFPPDSKIKLDKHRVRTIKIRGAISQGMILSLHELRSRGFLNESVKVGDDLADILEITKYEPPETKSPQSNSNQVKIRFKNPEFKQYTDIENFKWYPDLFQVGEEIVVLEKIHGSNIRIGYVPFYASTFWKKVKKFFGLAPKYEFVYGSHRVQLEDKQTYNGFYKTNVYMEAVEKYNLKSKLKDGEVIYGEVYGDGIQKNYHYGCQTGERKLIIFDVMIGGKYINHGQVVDFCRERGLPHVPVEYVGPFIDKTHIRDNFIDGPSTLCPEQSIREGVVIKPLVEQHCYMGRKILKWKSDNFLLTQEDDTH